MKLKTKMLSKVKKQLNSMNFYVIKYWDGYFKPEGEILTHDLQRGYFKVDLNKDETRIRINFQLLNIEPIILDL